MDVKAALARGEDLGLACRAILDALACREVSFDALGGPTMGADHLAHGAAMLGDKEWFVVRKAPKGRGTGRQIEGASLGDRRQVVLLEDVVTTGGSIASAFETIRQTGAVVTAALALVDRGATATRYFEARGVPYLALLTYQHLGIEPVDEGPAP